MFRHTHISILRSVTLAAMVSALAACSAPQTKREPLATVLPARGILQLTSTGFVVDNAGHVLTAGHAADSCREIYVSKDGQVLPAKLTARSSTKDLALLQVDDLVAAPAVFARAVDTSKPELVFAAGYQTLPQVLAEGGALSNAVLTTSRDSHTAPSDIELISDASFGTSGAPVIGAKGLVIGVVTHKLVTSGRVIAAHVESAKSFLTEQGVSPRQDDRPQLTALQDRASYVAAMSVTVICPK